MNNKLCGIWTHPSLKPNLIVSLQINHPQLLQKSAAQQPLEEEMWLDIFSSSSPRELVATWAIWWFPGKASDKVAFILCGSERTHCAQLFSWGICWKQWETFIEPAGYIH
jgi:hypothetical protein